MTYRSALEAIATLVQGLQPPGADVLFDSLTPGAYRHARDDLSPPETSEHGSLAFYFTDTDSESVIETQADTTVIYLVDLVCPVRTAELGIFDQVIIPKEIGSQIRGAIHRTQTWPFAVQAVLVESVTTERGENDGDAIVSVGLSIRVAEE
ncbi:MAG: hypothetical protein AAGJ19_13795 [Myxococcota bacterium]